MDVDRILVYSSAMCSNKYAPMFINTVQIFAKAVFVFLFHFSSIQPMTSPKYQKQSLSNQRVKCNPTEIYCNLIEAR